ncbi:MAG: hypothetical protein R6V19_10305 [Armatimonadota bacterium]
MFAVAWAALCIAAAPAPAGQPRTRLIYGFEAKGEIAEIEPSGLAASLTGQAEQVTQGRSALAGTFRAGESAWPGFRLHRRRLRGWDRFDLLTLDVTNLSGKPVSLSFRFDDARTRSYETRAHASKLLRPGRNTIAIPLKSLRRENREPFDVGSLRRVIIFMSRPEKDVPLVVDNIRLAEEVTVEIDVPNAHLFDFSAEGGMLFPGFVKVIPSTKYDARRKHGFVSTRRLNGSGGRFPDTLAGDAVCYQTPEWGRTPFTFRVNLPNGRYRVGYIVTATRFRDHRVQVEDHDDQVTWSAKELFSEKGIYFGLNDDYSPGKDLWKSYVEPAWPWRWAEVVVADGRACPSRSGSRSHG